MENNAYQFPVYLRMKKEDAVYKFNSPAEMIEVNDQKINVIKSAVFIQFMLSYIPLLNIGVPSEICELITKEEFQTVLLNVMESIKEKSRS
jgi:hypothetical protein